MWEILGQHPILRKSERNTIVVQVVLTFCWLLARALLLFLTFFVLWFTQVIIYLQMDSSGMSFKSHVL